MTELVIVGAGRIATEYAVALKHLGITPIIVGRGEQSAAALESRCGIEVVRGGLERFLDAGPSLDLAILAVDHLDSFRLSKMLIQAGPRALLLEKPGALRIRELEELQFLADTLCKDTRIALNRRYLPSVQQALNILQVSGSPVEQVQVTFDERVSRLIESELPLAVLNRWIWVQSIHIIDSALFLSGERAPKILKAARRGSLPWHPSGSHFDTEAQLQSGAPIRFSADWRRDGHWATTIATGDFELRLAPIEKLKFRTRSSESAPWITLHSPQVPSANPASVTKPGFVEMVRDFINGPPRQLPSLAQHLDVARLIFSIAGYH